MKMQVKTGVFDKKIYTILFVILAIATVVRINLLGLHRMHMDECLYSNYAMRMVDRGDLLLNGGLQVDKPPLFFLRSHYLSLLTVNQRTPQGYPI